MSRSSAARSARACRTASSASGRSASRTASARVASLAIESCSFAIARGPGGRGGLHRRAPAAGVDELELERGLPLEHERLLEGAQPARLDRLAPRHLEHVQAMQEPAALAVDLAAQVQRDLLRPRFGLEPEPALELGHVLLERDHRRLVRHGAQPMPDHELLAHDLQGQLGAEAQHRAGGVEQLVQPGERAVADAGQRHRQPRRVDDLRGARVQALGAQQPRGAREPARHGLLGDVEELVVPGGRVDARAVAGLAREQPVGPRHPRGRDLRLRDALQGPRVGSGRARGDERRRVPRAAHDRHVLRPALLAARICWRM